MGGVVSNVVDAVGDVVSGAGDVVQDVVIDPVSDALADFEDAVKKAVKPVFDGFNEVIEDPYVQLIASIVDPTPGKIASSTMRVYAKANAGEELTATDLATVGVAAASELGSLTIDPNTAKTIKAAASIADGSDPTKVLINTYGSKVYNSAIKPELETSFRTAVGDDIYNIVKDNTDVAKVGLEVATGQKQPFEAIADQYGQNIVDRIGIGDPAGHAALKTAVALDQGLDTDDAVLAGGEEFYKRGGQLPDINMIGSLAGLDTNKIDLDLNDFVADLNIDFPELKGNYNLLDLSKLGIDLPNLKGVTETDLLGEFELASLPDYGFNIPDLDLSKFKPTDLGYDVGTWKELQNLGVNIGELDLSEYNLPELADLNIDLQIPELDVALQNLGQPPSQVASLDMDTDLTGENAFEEFETPDITRLSRKLLGSVA